MKFMTWLAYRLSVLTPSESPRDLDPQGTITRIGLNNEPMSAEQRLAQMNLSQTALVSNMSASQLRCSICGKPASAIIRSALCREHEHTEAHLMTNQRQTLQDIHP